MCVCLWIYIYIYIYIYICIFVNEVIDCIYTEKSIEKYKSIYRLIVLDVLVFRRKHTAY